MVAQISNIDTKYFSFNGNTTDKVFIAEVLSDTHVQLVNVYDTTKIILGPTDIAEIEVGGVVHTSMSTFTNALKGITFLNQIDLQTTIDTTGFEKLVNKNVPGGYVGLKHDGTIDTQYLSLAITDITDLNAVLNSKLNLDSTAYDSTRLNGQLASFYATASNTYTKSEVDNEIITKVNEYYNLLLNNADAPINSIQELLDQLNSVDQTLINSIAEKVSYVSSQALTMAQKTIAQTNIGLENAALTTEANEFDFSQTAPSFLVNSSSGWLVKNTSGNHGVFFDGTETILVNNGGFGVRLGGSTVNLLNTYVTGLISATGSVSTSSAMIANNFQTSNYVAGVSGGRLESGTSSAMIMRFDADEFRFYSGLNATNPLVINQNGNVTSGNDFIVGNNILMSAGNIYLKHGSITTSNNQNLRLYPNGTGDVYMGSSSNGATFYHYSRINDGVWTTYSHTASHSTYSTTAPNGFFFSGDVTATNFIGNWDGFASATYMPSSVDYRLIGDVPSTATLDFDTITSSPGFYRQLANNVSTNSPQGGGYFYIENLRYGGPGGNLLQYAHPYRAGTEQLYYRTRFSGTWSNWIKVLTNNNFVAGTHYAAASHTHNYDNYQSWNLKTNGVQRTTITSGHDFDLIAGTNISLSYASNGRVTINSSLSLSGYATETYVNSQKFIKALSNPNYLDVQEVKKVTQAEYDALSTAEQNDETIMYLIGDFVPILA